MPKVEKEVIVLSPQGLHARPAALFVQMASKYDATITISKDNETVNGKSIMGILMLGAEKNSTIKLIAEGEDAEKALLDLEEFLSKDA